MRRFPILILIFSEMGNYAKLGVSSLILLAVFLAAVPLPAYGADRTEHDDTHVTGAASSAEDPGFAGTAGSAEKEAKVHGHEEGLVAEHGVTGDWGGLRDSLVAHGVTIKAVYTGEMASNFSGGALNKTGSLYHDNLDLTMSVDTAKAGLWEGGTFWIYGLRNHGADPSAEMIGDLQTASNIGAYDQFIVNEAWYNQDFADGAVAILAGLHNLNSEFYVTTYGTLFINSSFGVGPELSHNVPVSIFPQSGLGARLRVKPFENVYVQAAVYDGNPLTRELKSSEGNMTIAEAGYAVDGSDYKIGYWRHSAEKTYGDNTFDGDYGVYGIVDQRVLTFDNAAHSSIGVFLEYGWVPAERNNITGYLGGGVHMHGLIPTRDVDDLGFAVAMAKTHLDTETAYELTYRLVATSWLAVRPSLQWIQNPGGDASAKTANAGLLRFEIQL
jgi:porin